MLRNSTPGDSSFQLEIEFTDKPMTAFGGLIILWRFWESLRLSEILSKALPDHRTSPNARPVLEIVTAFLASLITGASRFAHVGRLRVDETLRTILGVTRIPSASTLTRYFGSFTQSQVEHLSECLWHWTLGQLPRHAQSYTLDLDSSVLTRYGRQQGAKKGYNPRKPGRPSHRPIFAFLAEAKIVANLWLRSGNTSDLSGVDQFLGETLAKMPPHLKIQAVRADSGFHDQKFFQYLEDRQIPYAVYARLDRRLQRTIAAAKDWQAIEGDPYRQCAEISYQALTWKYPRRLVVVRELVRPEKNNRGKLLFEIKDYTYTALFTTINYPPIEVWRFYNQRADAENRIKELKEDFAIDQFCLDSFWGTEAALRLIAFLFNLITLFKHQILHNPKPTFKTIRHRFILVAGQLGSAARTKILRLAAKGNLRTLLESLIDRLDTFDLRQMQCSWSNP